jgi:hypothetical protein
VAPGPLPRRKLCLWQEFCRQTTVELPQAGIWEERAPLELGASRSRRGSISVWFGNSAWFATDSVALHAEIRVTSTSRIFSGRNVAVSATD